MGAGRGGRHRRPERRRQDDAAQRARRRLPAERRHGRVPTARDVTARSAAQRCRLGLVRTHQVPKPFSGMTAFENVFVAAAHGAGLSRDEAYESAIAVARAVRHDAASPTGRPRRSACSTASGWSSRARWRPSRQLLLLDEIGGGLTDAEAQELVGTILELRRRGIAIVWIEHIVHVLLQVAERLICMDAGRIIADGEPKAVMADPAGDRGLSRGGPT